MRTRILPNSEAVSQALAEAIAHTLRPGARLALPSGQTPREAYALLGDWVEAGRCSFEGTRLFALDEFVGIPPEHPRSFAQFFGQALLSRIDLPSGHFHGPLGDADDPRAEAARYEALVSEAPLDVAVLGIGPNGHIAFNEPGPRMCAESHLAELAPDTRRLMGPDLAGVTHGITMGVGTLMRAHRIVLVATGPSKAEAIARALSGWVDPFCPASILQAHPDVEVLLDPAASGSLPHGGPGC